MKQSRLRLRAASGTDGEMLWRWRNDPETRSASFDGGVVPLDRHLAWLAATLARGDRRLYVVERDGVAVGTARLDLDGGMAEVSITVAPEARGQGVGTAALEALAAEAFGPLGLARLVARVKSQNRASRVAFERAGFRVVADGDVITLACEAAAETPGSGR